MRSLLLALGILLFLAWTARYPSSGTYPLQRYTRGDELALSGLRYKKGLELIRTLYEKLLALDYHFSSLHTGEWALQLGTPASYRAFAGLAGQMDRQSHNPQLWAALLLDEWQKVGLVVSSQEQERFFCLLDFCIQAHGDLRLIIYETAFLSRANTQVQQACRDLFEEYVRIIGYPHPLETCRKNDDWEAVFLALDQHLQAMRRRMGSGDIQDEQQLLRDHINLEFAVDRLLNFLDDYQDHIRGGLQYYQKFQMILDDLHPGPACLDDIPAYWLQLQAEIKQSLASFHQAYQVPELRGSRLKDLLYGFSD